MSSLYVILFCNFVTIWCKDNKLIIYLSIYLFHYGMGHNNDCFHHLQSLKWLLLSLTLYFIKVFIVNDSIQK